MFRVTSLTEMPEAQLNRWIKRIGILLLIGIVAFVAFYAVDRFRAPTPTIAERELSVLEEAVRNDPADIASRGRLADVYVALERYDDAIAQYTEIITAGKEIRAASYGRARALERKGSLDEAAADYKKVIEISQTGEMANVDPVLAGSYYGLGSIALKQDKPDEAVAQLEKAIAIQRTDADILSLLGTAYVKAGTPDKAIEPLRKAVLFVPTGWAEPYQALADAYTAKGQTDEAEWAAAMAAGQSGDTAGAIARLTAIAGGTAALDARIGLGLLAETSGEAATAADWYRKALETDPENQAATLGLTRVTDATQGGHPSIAPSPSAEGSN